MRERVHGRRLRLAGEHERRAAMRRQVLGDGVDVALGALGHRAAAPRTAHRRTDARAAIARAKLSIALAFIGTR